MGSYTPHKKLIVSADDFGLTQKVNLAIAMAYRDGIVTSASLMVNGAAFESAIEIVRRNADLDIGLHLNLTEGNSVSDPAVVPSLASRSGFLYDHPAKLGAALIRGKVRGADIEREIRAQLEKALNAGVAVTHIDGHKHSHVIPGVFSEILRVAPTYGIRGLRSTIERTPRLGLLLKRNRTAWRLIVGQFCAGKMLSAAFWMLKHRHRSSGVMTPTRFFGITQTGFLDLESLESIIRNLPQGVSEVMCHPGYADSELKKTPTRLHFQRERELALLTAPEVRNLLKQQNIELVSYKDLLRDYGSRNQHPILDRCSTL